MSRHTGFSLYLQKDLMNTVVFTFHEKLVAVEYYNCHGNCTYQNKRRSTGISIYFSHATAEVFSFRFAKMSENMQNCYISIDIFSNHV